MLTSDKKHKHHTSGHRTNARACNVIPVWIAMETYQNVAECLRAVSVCVSCCISIITRTNLNFKPLRVLVLFCLCRLPWGASHNILQESWLFSVRITVWTLWVPGYLLAYCCVVGGEEGRSRFLITDIAINSHSAALMLLWRPTPMGYAIKVTPFLYSCIL